MYLQQPRRQARGLRCLLIPGMVWGMRVLPGCPRVGPADSERDAKAKAGLAQHASAVLPRAEPRSAMACLFVGLGAESDAYL